MRQTDKTFRASIGEGTSAWGLSNSRVAIADIGRHEHHGVRYGKKTEFKRAAVGESGPDNFEVPRMRYAVLMAQKEITAADELEAELAKILVGWPLYRKFVYTGKGGHTTRFGEYGSKQRCALLPTTLKMFCGNQVCKQETWWKNDSPLIFFNRYYVEDAKYTCRNCGKQECRYYFIWQENPDFNIFMKIGQYPELEERVSEALSAALDATDLRLYKNALRMRNFNLGLAAVAYMRRVVENRMNDILDILLEAATAHNDATPELRKTFEEMKAEKRFAAKVEFAGKLLPSNLRPQGKANPMGVLHELASDGIHAKSDEECVDIFDGCRKTFEYVFGNLRIETDEAKTFVSEVATLAEKRSRAMAEVEPAGVGPQEPDTKE